MAITRRKVGRIVRKTISKSTSTAPRRQAASRKPASIGGDRLIRILQQRLFDIVCNQEGEGRSLIGVSAAFVQLFRQLTKVEGVAVYVRDEQTREMTCLAEAGCVGVSAAADWRDILAKAEQAGRVVSGAVQGFRLHRIGRMEGVVMVQGGKSQRLTPRKLLAVVAAVEPWLAVALDHARLTIKYAAKILRIQHLEQVSDLLNSSLKEEEKLRCALDAAIRLVEAEAGALFLEAGDGTLRLYSVSGERAAGLTTLQSSIAASVHHTGKAVLITQGQQDSRLVANQGWQAAVQVASLVSVPVRAGAQAVGVLEVVNRCSGKPFSNWDVLELASLSNQFGLAIQNLRGRAVGAGGSKQLG
jgi:hypothetical protein